MKLLKQLLLVSRPISWLNTAYPFAAGYLIFQQLVDLRFIVGTLFFLIPYNLTMYGVNDVFDYESDIQNPRKGSIEGALSAKKLHKPIIWASALTTIPPFIWLLFNGNLQSNLVLFFVMVAVLTYSVPLLRFKERPFLDSINSSIHFVGPLVYALALSGFPGSAWPLVLAFFCWGMASHAFGAVQDIIPDRKGKISSIATWLGAKKTTRLVALLYLTASMLVFSQGGIAIAVGLASLLYVLNVLPFVNLTDKESESANSGWRVFIFLNYFTGFVVTIALITQYLFF